MQKQCSLLSPKSNSVDYKIMCLLLLSVKYCYVRDNDKELFQGRENILSSSDVI